jgi:hypothetical protein
MPSPMSWQLSFLGCCPAAGESSEHWIVIWPAEYYPKIRPNSKNDGTKYISIIIHSHINPVSSFRNMCRFVICHSRE